MSVPKAGRPSRLEPPRDRLVKVTFKADADTMDALVRLAEASAAGRGRSRRSAAIRKALIEAAGRLPGVVRNGPTK